MDKKRFLKVLSPVYVACLTLLSLAALTSCWWFFLYAPTMEEISRVQRSYKIALDRIKSEKTLEKQTVEENGEILHLGLKKKVLSEQGGFSEDAVSSEFLNVIGASGATIVSLRVKPWREKEMRKTSEAEVAIRGSFGNCCAFLHNMHDRKACIKSCTLKNGEKSQVELSAVFKFYAGSDAIHHKDQWQQQDFISLKPIFSALKSSRDKNKEDGSSHSLPHKAHHQESSSRSPWVDLSKIRQVKRPKKQKDYRTKRVSRTTVVL